MLASQDPVILLACIVAAVIAATQIEKRLASDEEQSVVYWLKFLACLFLGMFGGLAFLIVLLALSRL